MSAIIDGHAVLSSVEKLSSIAMILQGVFLLLPVILALTMLPKSIKAMWMIIVEETSKLKRRLKSPKRRRDFTEDQEWTITRSPLHYDQLSPCTSTLDHILKDHRER